MSAHEAQVAAAERAVELEIGPVRAALGDDRVALVRDEAAEAQLKRHLAGCAECSAEMSELGALWERLGDLPAPEPSMAQHVPPTTITKAGMLMNAAGLPPSRMTPSSNMTNAPAMPAAVVCFTFHSVQGVGSFHCSGRTASR